MQLRLPITLSRSGVLHATHSRSAKAVRALQTCGLHRVARLSGRSWVVFSTPADVTHCIVPCAKGLYSVRKASLVAGGCCHTSLFTQHRVVLLRPVEAWTQPVAAFSPAAAAAPPISGGLGGTAANGQPTN